MSYQDLANELALCNAAIQNNQAYKCADNVTRAGQPLMVYRDKIYTRYNNMELGFPKRGNYTSGSATIRKMRH